MSKSREENVNAQAARIVDEVSAALGVDVGVWSDEQHAEAVEAVKRLIKESENKETTLFVDRSRSRILDFPLVPPWVRW